MVANIFTPDKNQGDNSNVPESNSVPHKPKFVTEKDDSMDRLLSERLEAKRRQKQREYERLARRSYILNKPEQKKETTEEDVVGLLVKSR